MTQSPQRRPGRAFLLAGVLAMGILAASCSGSDNVTPPNPPPLVDFTLTDVNVNSTTYNERVSIGSFKGRPLVFYVGKAG